MILVTGGAGYIGSFMTRRLLDDGQRVVIFDSLERGNKDFIDHRAFFVEGSLHDENALSQLFSGHDIDIVIHFAGLISMAESVKDPYRYFQTNTYGSLNLLEQMKKHDVKKIIFSSTAGVYGNPEKTPIPEDHPKNPTNPYGESKMMFEKILKWYSELFGISSVRLRYFNASGASLDGSMGEAHDPETHIIPIALRAALNGEIFQLFGSDYDTKDGTCVRDYIHVLDLVEAHVLAIQKLGDGKSYAYNVGTGKGFSNKEIVEAIRNITKLDLKIEMKDRRPGDADALIADASNIQKDLGFSPKYSDLSSIISSAFLWHKSQNNIQ